MHRRCHFYNLMNEAWLFGILQMCLCFHMCYVLRISSVVSHVNSFGRTLPYSSSRYLIQSYTKRKHGLGVAVQ